LDSIVKVLVVDDEQKQRQIIVDILHDKGYAVVQAADGLDALDILRKEDFAVILTDVKMPEMDGLALMTSVMGMNLPTQIILMTAFGDIPSAVKAIKMGAYDYLEKPFAKTDLLKLVAKAGDKARLLEENRQLRYQLHKKHTYGNLIGKSPVMRELYATIDRIKDIQATVLISGESGTGKEMVARAIHYSGKYSHAPFVAVNTGALPENLVESELFGFEKGTFTGAVKAKKGKFEQANGGTLFLDEIGTMSPLAQVKLLRVLQEKKIDVIGSEQSTDLDMRVIAATNEDLWQLVQQQRFREDLLHRLNLIHLEIPPLRKRREDIPLLARFFYDKYTNRYQQKQFAMDTHTLQLLENHDYAGNIRELENIIEKSVIMGKLMLPQRPGPEKDIRAGGETAGLVEQEKQMIEQALKLHRGSIKDAAIYLNISYKTLQYRIKKFKLDKNHYK
jgi:DNA-binding NtrC family response regulator